MPDWSYHPLLRPIGIALHGDRTRSLTVERMRILGSSALGRWAIRFLGHSAPAPQLAFTKAGIRFQSRVLLDASIDPAGDRKSTRLNSSHSQISYAVFCLKKKKK